MERPQMIKLAGKRFGRLTVKGQAPSNPNTSNRQARWLCSCDCGGEIIAMSAHLRSGATESCGCLKHEGRNIHGMANTPEYSAWANMKTRCLNKNSHLYHRYGGRGITICQAWLDSFESFYKDMGGRPSKNHSIDRTDNNKGYSPDNCRWATAQDQVDNRRVMRWFYARSPIGRWYKSRNLTSFSRICGLAKSTIYSIAGRNVNHQSGWSFWYCSIPTPGR